MTAKKTGWLPFAALTVLGLFGLRTISTSRTWLHLALGRTISEEGIPRTDPLSFTLADKPWMDANWLYNLVLYKIWDLGGPILVTLLNAGLVVLGFALLVKLARKYGGPGSIALGLLLSTWLLAPVFTVGARLACLPIAAGMMLISDRGRLSRKDLVQLGLLQLLWVQLDPTFLMGPLIPGAYAIHHRNSESKGASRKLGITAGACVLLCFLNPYGPALIAHLGRAAADVGYNYVTDWISAFSWHYQNLVLERLVTFSLVLCFLGIVIYPKRLPMGPTILGLVTAIAVIIKPAQVNELFSFFAFPFFVLSIAATSRYLSEKLPALETRPAKLARRGFVVLATGISLFSITSNHFFVTTGSASSFGLGVNPEPFPEAASTLIEQPGFPERVFNTAHDGGYLAWRYPDRKIFVDGRADLYTSIFYQHIADALSGIGQNQQVTDQKFREEFFEKHGVEGVILNSCLPGAGATAAAMLDSGKWGLAYFDGSSAIFLKRTDRYLPLLQNESIQKQGLEVLERTRRTYLAQLEQRLFIPPLSARLFGAAAVFAGVREYDKALPLYGLLSRGTTLPMPWVAMAFCRIKMNQYTEALPLLEYAAHRFPKHFLSQIWLSHVYAELGMKAEAQEAFNRASLLELEHAIQFGNPLDPKMRKKQLVQ